MIIFQGLSDALLYAALCSLGICRNSVAGSLVVRLLVSTSQPLAVVG
jgi:hypothetical protein